MAEPDPPEKAKEEPKPKIAPEGELTEEDLSKVAGGFNPQPEPPGHATNPIVTLPPVRVF